jgi:predicted metal-dependent peptidase
MADNLSEIETKLSAARTRLILEKPFIGTLVMHLPLVAADASWCKTTATDARAFYYNPQFVGALNLGQIQFVLAHEALHCALGHFARRQHRIKHRWDVACDHAVNLLLTGEGLKPPPGALLNELYRDLTAEEIYPFIHADTSEETLDHHLFDGQAGDDQGLGHDEDIEQAASSQAAKQQEAGAGAGGADLSQDAQGQQPGEAAGEAEQDAAQPKQSEPKEPSAAEKEELAQRWRQRLASAAQQALQAGRLDDSWLRALDDLLQPKLPWRMLLARYMMSVARDDYSFQRQSRREGEALLPSLFSGQADVMVVLDTSGSISDEEMSEFAAEVDALKGQIRARITLHACDANLSPQGPWLYEAWEPLSLPEQLSGGGGTRFTPIFEWVEREQRRPDLLLYFTDAEGEFPAGEPAYPVLWLVKGKAPVPWGQRIQLN